jgi:hypothetical protein
MAADTFACISQYVALATGDCDVLADGVVVGRIRKTKRRRLDAPWMWTLAFGHHEDRTPTHGYEPTCEAGMSLISLNVRFRGQPGPHLLATSSSQFDPTRTSSLLTGCEISAIPAD